MNNYAEYGNHLVCISFGGSAVRDVFSLEDPRWMAKGSRDGNRLTDWY